MSSQMLDDARKALNVVQMELQPHIDTSSGIVTNILDMNKDSDEKTNQINMQLDQMSESPRTDVLEKSKTAADKANKKAQNALKILSPIVKSLPGDVKTARDLPVDVDKTNKDITQINNQVEHVKVILPNIQNLVEVLERKQNTTNLVSSDIGDKIGKLRRQVEMARDIANSINVGVNFHPNTTLELKTPENLQLLATNSKISTFFRTEKPNGFVLYLGNGEPSEQKRAKHNDFMALEIENGYPVLTVDLGYGPERLISDKYVADGEWRQAIVERTGNNIQLTIREELENNTEKVHVANDTLTGPYSVFNVDQDSRLFVGGYPPDFNIQDGVKYSSFEGQIEGVKVGDNDVGLWNFVDGQDNGDGSVERNKLISKEPPTTGYRFSGNGYVILDSKPYSFKTRSSVQFKFKASRDTQNGLMFYAGKNRHFISIEMREGGILFQFKLGQHLVSFGTDKKFNDDQWHHVEAVREGRKGVLTVDNNPMYEEETPGSTEESLRISETMYFGGFPGKMNHSEVTKQSFDGCIDAVHISGTPVDLSRNLKAYGTRRGCPMKFSSTLTFAPHRPGYLSRGNISSNNYLQVNLKFRTKHEEGVLFYATNHDQSATFGLVLFEGQLYLSSNNESVASNKLNDGEWHIVTATHDSRGLRLDIDDSLHYNTDLPGHSLQISIGEIFFGGLPKGYRIPKHTLRTSAYLVGCITDVTVNEDVINFAVARDKHNAILDNCASDMFNYDLWTVQNYYPEEVQEVDIDQRLNGQDENENKITEDVKEEEEDITVAPYKPIPPPTKTTTKRPPPLDGPRPICQLPVKPEWDVDFDHGYRFGTGQFSRIEFTEISIKPRRAYDFAMEFKTDSPDGVLFYASDARHTDFIALYMQDGHLIHQFKGGAGTVNMTSTFKYHNNEWHTVMFSRSQNKGKLVVDGDDSHAAEASTPIRVLSVTVPFFFGGVSENVQEDVELNLKTEKGSYFKGCIRSISVAGRPVGEPSHMENVIPCSEQVESGTYFGGGYVKLRDKLKVGTDITISMDIKPRTQNGLLLSVHGKKAFLIVQLLNGTISFVVDNGDGPFEAVFKPEANDNFCDGEWRTVTVVKTKFVITVHVNGVNADPTIGVRKTASADTNRSLFLGGHPHLQRVRKELYLFNFVDCNFVVLNYTNNMYDFDLRQKQYSKKKTFFTNENFIKFSKICL